jgi:2-methylisocitrate lyase-like PEP mutase family enzyme
MTTTSQHAAARRFADLHRGGDILVLPNAWDVASACLVEAAGAAAIATTSAGVAWSLGAPDGDRLGRDRAVDLVARVCGAVQAPVTADIESGFGADTDGVAETVRGVLAAGAVGINLEDGRYGGPSPLRPVAEAAERVAAARQAADAAGVPLFVNARADTYLRAVGDPDSRLRETLDRASAYLAAGADGIFVPGVVDPAVIAVLVKEVPAPLNILAGHGAPSPRELGDLGVARVSVGPALAVAAYDLTRRAAAALLDGGEYPEAPGGLNFARLNAVLRAAGG